MVEKCSSISKITFDVWAPSEMMTGRYEAILLLFANARDTINYQMPGPRVSSCVKCRGFPGGMLAAGIESHITLSSSYLNPHDSFDW